MAEVSRICISVPPNIHNYLQRLRMRQGYKSMSKFVCKILLSYAQKESELEEESYEQRSDGI